MKLQIISSMLLRQLAGMMFLAEQHPCSDFCRSPEDSVIGRWAASCSEMWLNLSTLP